MGDGDPKIFIRIDRSVVDANFVVQVGSGGASAETDITDGVTAMDVLARRDRETRKMAVAGGDAVAVIHHDQLPVPAHEIRKGDDAIRRSDDRVTVVAANVHPAVKRAFPVERVDALPEAGGDLAINGPKIGK